MSTQTTHENGLLYLGFGIRPPEIPEMEVYETLETEFAGSEFVFNIIGSSHYVHSADCGFYEVTSCKQVDGEGIEVHTLDIANRVDADAEFEYDNGSEFRTEVSTYGLEKYRDVVESGGDFDLRHVFDEKAETAIDIGDTSYETYHTYPEYDLTVYTKTSVSEA
ncbi:MAG: hypothetical protein SXQ77_00270 [Halobacteria archaeon]|nr:hypothetical protein [Halobacteria archaeon]